MEGHTRAEEQRQHIYFINDIDTTPTILIPVSSTIGYVTMTNTRVQINNFKQTSNLNINPKIEQIEQQITSIFIQRLLRQK
eukprot:Pgem_evm1s2433